MGADKRFSMLFAPTHLGCVELKNRLAVSPMTRISATQDGRATEQMARYYAEFVRGGFGLVETEATYIDESCSRTKARQPGIANAAHAQAWSQVVEGVHAADGRIFIELVHAGALAQAPHISGETVAPSAVAPLGGKCQVPRALDRGQIDAIARAFARAAVNAIEAGFDGVDLHGGNGYLLDQFLTHYTNLRTDDYGGCAENRVRFLADVVRAVRSAVGPSVPVGIRISQAKVNDPHYRWPGGEADAVVIFQALADAGVTFLHISGPDASQPAFGEGPTLVGLAKRYGGAPVIANGSLENPDAAQNLIQSGDADLISLARGALANTDWPQRVKGDRKLEPFDPNMITPSPTLEHAQAWRERRRLEA
jgi:2,4-dienoyl-CoA reductase-like NADH-dependent reductase (Old Yellow Enzyme family)